jgi:hypothetical protein
MGIRPRLLGVIDYFMAVCQFIDPSGLLSALTRSSFWQRITRPRLIGGQPGGCPADVASALQDDAFWQYLVG